MLSFASEKAVPILAILAAFGLAALGKVSGESAMALLAGLVLGAPALLSGSKKAEP